MQFSVRLGLPTMLLVCCLTFVRLVAQHEGHATGQSAAGQSTGQTSQHEHGQKAETGKWREERAPRSSSMKRMPPAFLKRIAASWRCVSNQSGLAPSNRDAPLVIVIGQCRHQQLRRAGRLYLGGRNVFQDRVKQRLQVRPGHAGRQCRLPFDRVRVDDRELGLLVRSAQVHEQVERGVGDVVQPRVCPVYFIDYDNGLVAHLERLAQEPLLDRPDS